jgi:hypothetical protein
MINHGEIMVRSGSDVLRSARIMQASKKVYEGEKEIGYEN